MNTSHIRKRNAAFIVCGATAAVCLFLLSAMAFRLGEIRPTPTHARYLVLGGSAAALSFWLKGFYHWARGKGYPWILSLVGLLGFPFGLILMGRLQDRIAAVAAPAGRVGQLPTMAGTPPGQPVPEVLSGEDR